jgi:hypothetical protein
MGYINLFCRPNYPYRELLATEHYQKAKASVDLLDLNTEVAVRALYNPNFRQYLDGCNGGSARQVGDYR